MPTLSIIIIIVLAVIAAAAVIAAVYFSRKSGREIGAARGDRGELKSILASLNDALITYDENFIATYFNPAAERLFRINAKDVVGHKFIAQDIEREGWRMLIQVIFPSLAPRVLLRTEEGAHPQVADVSFIDPEIELRVTTSTIEDEHGKTIGFMKIIHDRTPQIMALRSRGEFVTIASHQLRGPMTDISWALQTLSSAKELSPDDKTIVDTALASARGAIDRIDSLINISKMDEGKVGYQFKEDDAVDFVGKVLSDILPAARKAGVNLYFDRPSAPLPKVAIDRDRLSLALINIVENAIRYNVQNGEVVVKVDALANKPFLEISVRDTGIGIPPEAMSKLFTKFYRAENAVKSQTEGSGLGLYIAKSVVRAHGGEIWAESELNRGTVIHFTLPTDLNIIPKHEFGIDEGI